MSSFASINEKELALQPQTLPSLSPYLMFLRAGQYLFSVVAIIFTALAVDRTLLTASVTNDELLALITIGLALVVIPLYTYLATTRPASKLPLMVDALISLLLLATLILGSVNQAQGNATCSGPAKIGQYDNRRACRKMKVATVLVGLDFVVFGASTFMGWRRE